MNLDLGVLNNWAFKFKDAFDFHMNYSEFKRAYFFDSTRAVLSKAIEVVKHENRYFYDLCSEFDRAVKEFFSDVLPSAGTLLQENNLGEILSGIFKELSQKMLRELSKDLSVVPNRVILVNKIDKVLKGFLAL